MHRFSLTSLFLVSSLVLHADTGSAEAPVELTPVTVYSPLVANQEPVGSFAMPVSALRYEPLVDVQARNLAEGQADVSIRGGTFENTGFSIGALPIYDPQTGHYFAELPVAPAMLGAPTVRTGADTAMHGWNATAGSVAYVWQPVHMGGYVSVGAGDNSLVRGDAYAGYVSDKKIAGRTLAADVNIAASQGDGTRDFGDHDFARYNARIQLGNEVSQTDVFAGYQSKFFGWQNLYAGPFNSNETENLQTTLYALNHRVSHGADGDYFQVGAYHRRNVDDYEFNRLPPADTFWHETKVNGAAFDGRISLTGATALRYRAGVVADEIDSLALTFGPYESRTQLYTGLFADHVIALTDARDLVLTAGANYEDSNRDGSAVSPTAEIAVVQSTGSLRRVYVSYAENTQLPTYTAISSNPAGGLFGGNPDLGRSEARNYELGAHVMLGGWSTRAAVFYRQDRDLVDWVFGGVIPPPPIRRAVAGDIDTYGFEAVARREWRHIDLVLGYTVMDKNEDYLAAGESSFYAYNYAEHRLTAAIVARLGGGFELRMDNEGRIQEENALRSGDDDVILSSLGLYYAVPRVKGLTLSAQVDNLWNTYYEEVPLVPGARREISFGARYAW
ncbi:MAG: TonB-dependent receptor [Rariglobus sp.]|jgi:hypothetical protein|nr:TonB-dependent receptor [Rariglobus sp.]